MYGVTTKSELSKLLMKKKKKELEALDALEKLKRMGPYKGPDDDSHFWNTVFDNEPLFHS